MLEEELRDAELLAASGSTIPNSIRRRLDPRARLLSDLEDLIAKARREGYRPIVCMDANEDWTSSSGKPLAAFLQSTGLKDPLYDKFYKEGITPATYARGSKRIDYMFFDEALVPAITAIGTLGLHEAMVSDHVMVYADLDESKLFDGLLNRPVRVPNREFLLAQADKQKKFLEAFHSRTEQCKFKRRVLQLASLFRQHGPTPSLVKRYNDLDSQIQQRLVECAALCIKKKFGYTRSPALGLAGKNVNFWKSIDSASRRRKEPPARTIKMAEELGIDLLLVRLLSRPQLRKKVRESVERLRKVQYEASEHRQQWLERNSQDIARAAGEPDWKLHMEKMLSQEKTREVNRKLTALVKGAHQGLNLIEVPVGEWFYSRSNREIYRYDHGVFECYSPWSPTPSLIPTHPWKFYSHHHLKVPHEDIVHAEVYREGDFYMLHAVSLPTQIWRSVTDPEEMETLLLQRNRRHLQQAIVEEGHTHDPIIQRMMSGHGTDLLDEIKSGTLDTSEATDEVILAWIAALKQTDAEAALPPVTGEVSAQQFRDAFKAVSERTSSAGKIHYTIWKCIAQDEELAEWLLIMMSLPFMYGFPNNRWMKSIDVMLEKKQGVKKIHMLRIIALLEADFNTALKIFFARRLMDNAEQAGLNDEQWGSRRNRMALDPAMRKLMTFEYGRYMRATIAMFAADLTACFDRMYPALGSLVSGKFGMDVNILRCKGMVMEGMERSVRTGYGVSVATYGNRPGEPPMAGEGQGKGDVAIVYVLQSSTLFDAHATLSPGLCLPPPVPGPGIKKRNDGYVDDVDTWAGVMEYHLLAAEEAMYALQKSSQYLTDLNEVPGGSTAFHKCAVFLLSWKTGPRKLEINQDVSDLRFILTDNKGAPSSISILRPDQTNKGLGYHMAVDANQTKEYSERRDKVSHICTRAQSSRFSYSEALQLLNQRLLMQLKYGLVLSQFTPKQCHPLTVMINATFLPLLHIHRQMPRAVVWGPKSLGGLGLNTNVYNLQAQCAIGYMIRAIRWNGIVANDIIATLNAYQLVSGWESPLLEDTSVTLKYLPQGWLPHVREMLRAFGSLLWVENAWRPHKQRQGDTALMEDFCKHPDITDTMLLLANEYRMWMGIIFISELANIEGDSIPISRIYNGSEWRATPVDGMHWPNVRDPTDKHRAAFRKCLRLT
jgi:hypothetical protein